MGALSSTLRRSFVKNKLSIALTFNDIIYTFITKVSAKYEGVDYRFKTQRDSRYFGLNIRYNFGSDKVRGVRNRNSSIEDETRRAN